MEVVHTITSGSSQPERRPLRLPGALGRGLENVIAAAQASGVRRIVYVTSLGIAPDAPSTWLRERWQAEEQLLGSGLDASIFVPVTSWASAVVGSKRWSRSHVGGWR